MVLRLAALQTTGAPLQLICFVLERRSEADSCLKVRRLLEVESVLVNEYAGDIRTKINATAG